MMKLFKFLSRRQVLTVGAMGVAGVAATTIAQQVQANTQRPVAAQTAMNPNGKFMALRAQIQVC
jgi:hypothetical protein